MFQARGRLAGLWLSQVCRIVADWSLRMAVLLKLVQAGDGALLTAWHLVTAVFITPFILLAPLNGAVSNGLPKRRVLAGSAAYCLGAAVLFLLPHGPWLVFLALLATGTAVYSPTRYALLPAAAQDGRLPLSRVNGLIEMGGAAAIIAGLVLGQLDQAPLLAVGFSILSLLAALPVRFDSDVCRPEAAGQAVAGFFRDCRRIGADPAARGSLFGLAAFLAVVTAGSGVVLSQYLPEPGAGSWNPALTSNLILVTLGVAAGSLLAGVQGHLRRGLGLVPIGVGGLLVALAWAAAAQDHTWPCLALGFTAGLVSVPLRAFYQASLPADARGNGMAVSNTANYVLTVGLSLALILLVRLGVLTTLTAQLWALAALAATGFLVAGKVLLREAVEQALEVLIWPVYRIRAHGPGVEHFPARGPVVVLANHASWFDPIWVGKVLPRRFYPMMTSMFFDRPVLHFLMTRVVHAIRVPVANFRREAPELRDAGAVLDRGECLLIFPEGLLRRKEGQLLRPFGQGIWHILRDRPDTPVVACWIEGGWGSFFSFRGGPPMTGKRPDWWKRIRIGVSAPEVIDPAVLADQRATRHHLRRACLEARKHLGLDVPAAPESAEAEPAVSEDDPVTS